MSSPARPPNYAGKSVAAFPVSEPQCNVESPGVHNANRFTAFSFEFVAKPAQAANAVLDLPAAIQSTLADFAGLDHCLREQQSLAYLRASLGLSNPSSSIDTNLIASDSVAQEADICVA